MTKKSKRNLMVCISCKRVIKVKSLPRKAAKYEGFDLLCPFCGAKLQPYTQNETEGADENQTELTQFVNEDK